MSAKLKPTRIIAVFMAVLMITACLAACGIREAVGPPVSQSTGEPKIETLKCLVYDSGAHIKFVNREGTIIWDEFTKIMREEYLLDFDFEIFTTIDEYNINVPSRFAANLDLPDYTLLFDTAFNMAQLNAYANQGLFLPIDVLVNDYCRPETKAYIEKWFPSVLTNLRNPVDGHTYWFSEAASKNNIDIPYDYQNDLTAAVRKDWLDKFDLGIPQTIEELLEMGRVFHENDANGNGIIGDEVFAIGTTPNYLQTFGNFFGLITQITGAVIADPAKPGESYITSPWYQPGMKAWLEFMKEVDAQGLLSTEEVNALAATDRLIGGMNWRTGFSNAQDVDPDAFYLSIPLIQALPDIKPVRIQGYYATDTLNSSFQFAFTNKMKGREDVAARLLDAIYTEWYDDMTNWGVLGVNYEILEDGTKNLLFVHNPENAIAYNSCQGLRIYCKTQFPWLRITEYSRAQIQRDFDLREKQRTDDPSRTNAHLSADYMINESLSYIGKGFPTVVFKYGDLYGLPTDAEGTRKNEIYTDILTYSDELIANIVSGAKSINDWDQYITDLKRIGLDELIEIDQKLYERKFAK